jgi:hypothetical protein
MSKLPITVTSLIGKKIEGADKWDGSVRGADGCIYGIPFCASRVLKFDPTDHSIKLIGPDLGDENYKWSGGTLAKNGIIYCNPFNSDKILKIDTIYGTVTLMDITLPESGESKWASSALASDGNIYCMPCLALRILKIDASNDGVSSVGYAMHGTNGFKFMTTVAAGNNGYIYGIPHMYDYVLQFNPQNQSLTRISPKRRYNYCCGGAAVGGNGLIYALSHHGFLLTVDPIIAERENYDSLGHICTTCVSHIQEGREIYGDGISGSDGCIYWPPVNASQVLKFDPESGHASLVDGSFEGDGLWTAGALDKSGIMYCIPSYASQILAIDPCQEFREFLKEGMDRHPEKLGNLFNTRRENVRLTEYEFALSKYGHDKTLQIIEG